MFTWTLQLAKENTILKTRNHSYGLSNTRNDYIDSLKIKMGFTLQVTQSSRRTVTTLQYIYNYYVSTFYRTLPCPHVYLCCTPYVGPLYRSTRINDINKLLCMTHVEIQ